MVNAKSHKNEYDVILSYAIEDREDAKTLADALRRFNVSVYDENEQRPVLDNVYSLKARLCVVLLSRHYVASWHTRYALEVAQARTLRDTDYIFYVRLDETTIPGLPPAALYLKDTDRVIDDIFDIIDKGKSEQSSQPPLPSSPEPKDTLVVTPSPDVGSQTGAPDTAEKWVDKGNEHYAAKRYKEALHAYEQAIRLNPKYARAYIGKGNTLGQLGYDNEAKDAYRLAQQLGD